MDLIVINCTLILSLFIVGVVFIVSDHLFRSSHIYDAFASIAEPWRLYFGWNSETQWGVTYLGVAALGVAGMLSGNDRLFCTSVLVTCVAHIGTASAFVWSKPFSISWFNFCWALQAMWIFMRCVSANPRRR